MVSAVDPKISSIAFVSSIEARSSAYSDLPNMTVRPSPLTDFLDFGNSTVGWPLIGSRGVPNEVTAPV